MTNRYRGKNSIMDRLLQNAPLPSANRIAQDRRDALAEIERLRAVLRVIMQMDGENDLVDAWTLARAALTDQQNAGTSK